MSISKSSEYMVTIQSEHRERSFIANQFKFSLSLEELTETLEHIAKSLGGGKQLIEQIYPNEQMWKQVRLETLLRQVLGSSGEVDLLGEDVLVYKVERERWSSIKGVLVKRAELIATINIMLTHLNQYISCHFLEKSIDFSSQHQLLSIFWNIFGNSLFESNTFRKICSEIWKYCNKFCGTKANTNTSSTSQSKKNKQSKWIYMHLELFIHGYSYISERSEDYPLHAAVIHSDLPTIRRICIGQSGKVFWGHRNEIDIMGHTALALAIKLHRDDAILVLCDHFADPEYKPFPNIMSPLEMARAMKDRQLLSILITASNRCKQLDFDKYKQGVNEVLERIPDFSINMNMKCTSNLPFVGSIAPSDTYRITKMGSSIRVDMSLIGWRRLKCVRGKLSILFKGRTPSSTGDLLIIDHEESTVENMMSDLTPQQIDAQVDDIIKNSKFNHDMKNEFKFHLSQSKNGKPITQKINSFQSERYKAECNVRLFKKPKIKEELNRMTLLNFRKFKKYFEYAEEHYDVFKREIREKYKAYNLVEMCKRKGSRGDQVVGSILPQSISSTNIPNRNIQNTSLDPGQSHTHRALIPATTKINVECLTARFGELSSEKLLGPTDMGSDEEDDGELLYQEKGVKNKKYKGVLWISKQYPLKLDQFLPLLRILSYSSIHIKSLTHLLETAPMPSTSFPLKATIPLFLGLKAQFTLSDLLFRSSKEEYMNPDWKIIGKGSVSHFPYIHSRNGSELKMCNREQLHFEENIRLYTLGSCLSEGQGLPKSPNPESYTSYREDQNQSLAQAEEMFNRLLSNEVEGNISSQSDFLDVFKEESENGSGRIISPKPKLPSPRRAVESPPPRKHIVNIGRTSPIAGEGHGENWKQQLWDGDSSEEEMRVQLEGIRASGGQQRGETRNSRRASKNLRFQINQKESRELNRRMRGVSNIENINTNISPNKNPPPHVGDIGETDNQSNIDNSIYMGDSGSEDISEQISEEESKREMEKRVLPNMRTMMDIQQTYKHRVNHRNKGIYPIISNASQRETQGSPYPKLDINLRRQVSKYKDKGMMDKTVRLSPRSTASLKCSPLPISRDSSACTIKNVDSHWVNLGGGDHTMDSMDITLKMGQMIRLPKNQGKYTEIKSREVKSREVKSREVKSRVLVPLPNKFPVTYTPTEHKSMRENRSQCNTTQTSTPGSNKLGNIGSLLQFLGLRKVINQGNTKAQKKSTVYLKTIESEDVVGTYDGSEVDVDVEVDRSKYTDFRMNSENIEGKWGNIVSNNSRDIQISEFQGISANSSSNLSRNIESRNISGSGSGSRPIICNIVNRNPMNPSRVIPPSHGDISKSPSHILGGYGTHKTPELLSNQTMREVADTITPHLIHTTFKKYLKGAKHKGGGNINKGKGVKKTIDIDVQII